MTSWDSNECTMNMITQCYKAILEDVKDKDIDKMMRNFSIGDETKIQNPSYYGRKVQG